MKHQNTGLYIENSEATYNKPVVRCSMRIAREIECHQRENGREQFDVIKHDLRGRLYDTPPENLVIMSPPKAGVVPAELARKALPATRDEWTGDEEDTDI